MDASRPHLGASPLRSSPAVAAPSFPPPGSAGPILLVRWDLFAAAALIALFVLLSVSADLWPVKALRYHFAVDELFRADFLTMDLRLSPAQRYVRAHSGESGTSLAYCLALKLGYALIPRRTACFRAVSVAASALSLWVFFLLARRLFSSGVALLSLLVQVMSPMHLESMRAFGFLPLTLLNATLLGWFLALSLDGRRKVWAIVGMAASAYVSLSLYAAYRMLLFLPLFVYASSLRRHGWKLLLYLALIAAVIVASDLAFRDVRFRLADFFQVGGEWLGPGAPDSPNAGGSGFEVLGKRLSINLPDLRAYLLRGLVFSTEHVPSRLVRLEWTPWFLVGLAICAFRRRPGDILILSWFALTALPPVLSSEYTAIRIMASFRPYILLAAWGAGSVYAVARSRLGARSRSLLAAGAALYLVAAGARDVHAFLYRESKPIAPYSRPQLERLAALLSASGERAPRVLCRGWFYEVIWGNPYLDPSAFPLGFARRMIPPSAQPGSLRRTVEDAWSRSERTLIFAVLPFAPPAAAGEAEESDRDYLLGLFAHPDPRIECEQIAGVDEVYFLAVRGGKTP